MQKNRVNTFTATYSQNGRIQFPFNQIEFLNYDPNSPVTLNNDIIIQPAIPVNGFNYPTSKVIALNVSEVSDDTTYFNLDFHGSTTAHLVVVHTEYSD